jgi:gluconate kinase
MPNAASPIVLVITGVAGTGKSTVAGSFEEITALLSSRRGHFMPVSLLESQLDTLEPLEPDENGIVVRVGQLPQEEADEIVERLGLGGGEPPVDAKGRLDS